MAGNVEIAARIEPHLIFISWNKVRKYKRIPIAVIESYDPPEYIVVEAQEWVADTSPIDRNLQYGMGRCIARIIENRSSHPAGNSSAKLKRISVTSYSRQNS